MNNNEIENLGELMSVCECKGSIAYAHFQCLKSSLELKFGKEIKNEFKSKNIQEDKRNIKGYDVRRHECEICKV